MRKSRIYLLLKSEERNLGIDFWLTAQKYLNIMLGNVYHIQSYPYIESWPQWFIMKDSCSVLSLIDKSIGIVCFQFHTICSVSFPGITLSGIKNRRKQP